MGAFPFDRGGFLIGAKTVPFCEISWRASRSTSCGNRPTLREKPFQFHARAHSAELIFSGMLCRTMSIGFAVVICKTARGLSAPGSFAYIRQTGNMPSVEQSSNRAEVLRTNSEYQRYREHLHQRGHPRSFQRRPTRKRCR